MSDEAQDGGGDNSFRDRIVEIGRQELSNPDHAPDPDSVQTNERCVFAPG